MRNSSYSDSGYLIKENVENIDCIYMTKCVTLAIRSLVF